ncbi:MAG: hypothetical protein AB7S92_18090 [Parvibaculaceae bacterium]
MDRRLGAGAVLLLAGLWGSAAQAEIGKTTAQPGEWYWGLTGSAAFTTGATRQVAQKLGNLPTDSWENVDFDDGSIWTLGLEVGHSLADPGAWVDRLEFNFDASVSLRSAEDEEINAGLATRDADSTVSYQFGSNPEKVDIKGNDTQVDLEARISFKNVLTEDDDHTLLTSIEPFFRYQSNDGQGTMSFKPQFDLSSATREDGIDAYYVGIQAALEMEQPVAESLNLIGRASVGVYYVDSDISAEIEDSGFAHDGGDAIGGRFGAALGFKSPLFASGASFSIVATADYFTDVATIEHAEQSLTGPLSSTKAEFDDRLDLGARVGIVVPLH